jgi:signal transduction histidine kinase
LNPFVARLMGRSPDEMLGKTDDDWAPPTVALQFRANDLEVLATQKSLHRIEALSLPNQGTTYWLACKFPLCDAQGRRFVGGVSVDVTAAKRMEEEMLAVAEREQQRIGHDLHDGLGQQLTALEMKCFLLSEELAAKDLAARREQLQEQTRWISEALRECITLTRSLARGLAPANLKAEGLMDALNGLTQRTQVPGKVECCFNCPSPVTLENAQTARHLYRIAQEAVNNAFKHARTRRITVKLSQSNNTLQLQIKDDGQGLPKIQYQCRHGAGSHAPSRSCHRGFAGN